MDVDITTEVEFLGGPIDGHVATMSMPLQPFLGVRAVAAASVLSTIAQFLRVRQPAGRLPLAIYELEQAVPSRQCYHYRGTQAVTREQLRTQADRGVVVQRLG